MSVFVRKSGGQLGNQNARKHGYYSKILTPSQKRGLKLAAGLEGLNEEFAVMRVILGDLVASKNQNPHLINETVGTLIKLYKTINGLNQLDDDRIKEAICSSLAGFIAADPPQSGSDTQSHDK